MGRVILRKRSESMPTVERVDTEEVAPVVVTARQLAIMLQVSKRTLFRMRSAGRLPAPLRVGGVVRWRLQDVQNWIANGCPSQNR